MYTRAKYTYHFVKSHLLLQLIIQCCLFQKRSTAGVDKAKFVLINTVFFVL